MAKRQKEVKVCNGLIVVKKFKEEINIAVQIQNYRVFVGVDDSVDPSSDDFIHNIKVYKKVYTYKMVTLEIPSKNGRTGSSAPTVTLLFFSYMPNINNKLMHIWCFLQSNIYFY